MQYCELSKINSIDLSFYLKLVLVLSVIVSHIINSIDVILPGTVVCRCGPGTFILENIFNISGEQRDQSCHAMLKWSLHDGNLKEPLESRGTCSIGSKNCNKLERL